jgi:hypothetical protein
VNTVALLYTLPLDDDKFMPCADRWVSTYHKFSPGFAHDIFVCFCNAKPTEQHRSAFYGMSYQSLRYKGAGWDVGSYQFCSKQLTNYPLVVYQNARSYFYKSGWLKRLMEAREQNPDPNALYGVSASYEACPVRWPMVPRAINPHIRTTGFATSPNTLSSYPYKIDSRNKCFRFESGDISLSKFYEEMGWPVWLVTWDGMYRKQDWRTPNNVFRKGDQSNLLVMDKHAEIFSKSPPEIQRAYTISADGSAYSKVV